MEGKEESAGSSAGQVRIEKEWLTHKKIVRLGARPADFEEFHHIKELSMYVSAYLDVCGRLAWDKVQR
jgi:hypothetical protein